MAKMIPLDGEGASHLLEVIVSGAENDRNADQIARTVASSNLVKTAMTGNDPNWGRIVSAVGYSGVTVDPHEIGLRINGIQLFDRGCPVAFDAGLVSKELSRNVEVRIEITAGSGSGKSRHWTSDLTEDYVRFNSQYTT